MPRATRFHDEDNVFMGWQAFRHLPSAILQYGVAHVIDRRPELPWWPFDAIRHIEGLLDERSRVIEFGSGQSTPWLARRASRVVSIEDDPLWHARITSALRARGVRNVEHELRAGDAYARTDMFPDAAFDLAVIDGAMRYRCVEAVLPKLAPGGSIYLDNADADKDHALYRDEGRLKLAQARLLDFAEAKGAAVSWFRGLAPCTPFAQAGVLVTLP